MNKFAILVKICQEYDQKTWLAQMVIENFIPDSKESIAETYTNSQ